jgi:glycosyltransferase involved in cell wall biosynthesis
VKLEIMEFAIYILALVYFTIIFYFFIGILFLNSKKNKKINNISIIIAARNEEKQLPNLLNKLINQNYPQENYEIIVVNDRSEDNTFSIIEEFQKKNINIRLVNLETESRHLLGKKGALDAGIRTSRYGILAFTDADCIPTLNWLQQINAHFTENTDIIAGYSYVQYKSKLFKLLKNLERSSIFAVIAGGFGWNWGITITAGNMAYRKGLYHKVNGFDDIGTIRSGDDVLMIQKMSKYARNMSFMFHPDSIINTGRNETAGSQVQQETRRGSKWKYYIIPVKIMTLFIFLYYLIFTGCFLSLFLNVFSLSFFLNILLIKIIPEFLLMTLFLIRIKKLKLMWVFPIAELFYIPYFIFFGIKGTWGKYKWKE